MRPKVFPWVFFQGMWVSKRLDVKGTFWARVLVLEMSVVFIWTCATSGWLPVSHTLQRYSRNQEKQLQYLFKKHALVCAWSRLSHRYVFLSGNHTAVMFSIVFNMWSFCWYFTLWQLTYLCSTGAPREINSVYTMCAFIYIYIYIYAVYAHML